MPRRFGVNALYLIPGGVGGTETYLRSLLGALAALDAENQYYVFTNRETGAGLVPAAANFHHAPTPVRAVSRPRRILWEQTALPLACAARGLDALFNPGFTAPIACPCPQVTMFHDLQHKRHPEFFRWFDRPFWNFFLAASAQLSQCVLADSAATARDVAAHYRLPERKIRITPLGVDDAFFAISRRRAPEPFLLAISTLHPHKNLDRLLTAFAHFRRSHPEFRLVVCGLHGFESEALHRRRDELGLSGAVDFPGWVPRPQLLSLLERAWAFCYPSQFEGFGFPPLEAMAAGVPTVCSDIEPLAAHTAGAALRFHPESVQALEAALERITVDEPLRARLAVEGPLRAAQFSWRATAEATLAALVSVC